MMLFDEMAGMIDRRHGSANASRWKLAVGAGGVALCLTLFAAPLYAHVLLDYPNGGEELEAGSIVP
jgi:hypothetical protein